MKTQCIFLITLLIGISCVEAEDVITGGEVRAVLDDKYALTSEGYAEYRKCIANIPFGGPMKDYKAALEDCKAKAKAKAFILTPSDSHVEPTKASADIAVPQNDALEERNVTKGIIMDRNWQKQIYSR